MKKSIFSFLLLLLASQIHAQVGYWIIPPHYDSIYFATGANLIITDSLDQKIVWTLEGKRLFKTADDLHPFSDGLAVATKKESDEIIGFYSTNGAFTPIENCKVANDYPFYVDVYMAVKRNNKYFFVDTKGKLNERGIIKAYPFHNGHALCIDYKNPEKPRDAYNFLINKDKERIVFTYNGRNISPDDVEFISSMNDEGLCIVVARHLVYYFVGEGQELRPVFARPEEPDLKRQAKLKGRVAECLTSLDNANYTLIANCGKTDQISIRFDSRLVPLEFWCNADRQSYRTNITTRETPNSPITTSKKDGRYDLSLDGIQILPEQFEAIYDRFGENAFVKLSGKQGLIRVSKEKFQLTINNDQEIGFRHKTFETTIRLKMPHFIPIDNTMIEMADSNFECEIDPTTRMAKKTQSGNFIEYHCNLTIPQNLSDEITEFDHPYLYPFQIYSDGIKFPIYYAKVKAWYVKHFIINIVESETKIVKQGSISFTLDINDQKAIDDKFDYHKIAKIVPDTLDYDYKKISDTRYEFQVENLNYGINDLTIEVMEEGCPPSTFDMRINYAKPSPKTRNKEKVEVKKKSKEEIDEPVFKL